MQRLESELKQLEAEYNMFFSGRLPKPPWETRGRVEALVKQYGRAYIQNTADRFRFEALQTRFAGVRRSLGSRPARARGRACRGRLRSSARRSRTKRKPRIASSTSPSFQDPLREMDKLTELYESLVRGAPRSRRGRRCRSTSSPTW